MFWKDTIYIFIQLCRVNFFFLTVDLFSLYLNFKIDLQWLKFEFSYIYTQKYLSRYLRSVKYISHLCISGQYDLNVRIWISGHYVSIISRVW